MPSPFSVFRSNLKPLMVALTLLSLFAFVALPALQMYQQYNLTGVTDVQIATYDGGSFSEAEVAYFNRTHGQTTRFLTAVAEEVIQRGGTPRVPGFQIDPRTGQVTSVGISTINSTRNAVLTQLHANQALELGLELDDAAIEQWMALFTDGKLSQNELAGIRSQVSQNFLGQSQLYNHLRTELLATLFQRIGTAGLSVGQQLIVPPSEAWLQFLKINQEAVVTAYPVIVEEFLDETSEPTPAEIEAIYAEGKENFPNPDSSEPAFRRRYAANVEYVSASLDDFVAREVAKLSEEEIRAEYERRAAGGDFQLPPAAPAPSTAPASVEQASDEQAAPAEDTASEPADMQESAADAPASDAPAADAPASDSPAVTEVPAEDAPAEQPSGEEAEAPEPTDQPEPAEEPATDEPSDAQSLRTTNSVFRFAALRLQDEDEPSQEAPAADEPPAEQPAQPEAPAEQPTEQPADAANAPEQPAPVDPPAAAEPRMENASDSVPSEAVSSEQADPANAAPEDQPTAAEAPAEEPAGATRPFEEVRDQIARSMVIDEASRALDQAVTEVNSAMRSYFTQSAVYDDLVKTDASVEKPERPNLKQLAEQLGLDYGQTGLQDALSVRDTAIGQSRGLGEMMFRRGDPFGQLMYTDTKPLFTPLRTANDAEQITFVSWKTEDREAYIPELEEVRDEVVAAARTIEARKLALAHAEELAAKANAAGEQGLAAAVPENRQNLIFKDLGPFPWLRYFGPGTQPFIAGVPELNNVGEEFMETVFRGALNEFGVGPNAPKSVYYVVKTTDLQPPTEELRSRFMRQDQRQAASSLAFEDASQIYGSWAEAFEERIGLKWNEEALTQ